jgi:hypothetical protein
VVFLRNEVVETWLNLAQYCVEISRRSIVRMDLVLAVWRSIWVVTRGGQERRAKTARKKRKRSPLTGPPQEFPPAEPAKPTFFPRGLQAILPFRGEKNLASGFRSVNQRSRRTDAASPLPKSAPPRDLEFEQSAVLKLHEVCDSMLGASPMCSLRPAAPFAVSARRQNALKSRLVAAVGV